MYVLVFALTYSSIAYVRYEFKLEVISESIRAGLWDLVERQPHIKLIFMGQRRYV